MCKINHLPPRTICAYRVHFPYEIANHQTSHSKAIKENKNNNARQFKISPEYLSNLLDKSCDKPTLTAVQLPNGNVVYVKQSDILKLAQNNSSDMCKSEEYDHVNSGKRISSNG